MGSRILRAGHPVTRSPSSAEMGLLDPDTAEVAQKAAVRVLRMEGEAVLALARQLPDSFADAVALVMEQTRSQQGRVIVSGMGKSGHVGRKIASTLASTGTPAQFVHPAEASHGDLGMITPSDVCLVLSNSGETGEINDIIDYSRRFSVPLIAMTGSATGTLARSADITLLIPEPEEACPIGLAPTTSTTCALALGDAFAVTLMELRGFRTDSFQQLHPGGRLGARLLRVRDIMHRGDALPVVPESMPMGEVLVEMTAKGFGTALVVSGDRLVGVITDGDLRRNLAGLLDQEAGEVATRNPMTIDDGALVSEALAIMNAKGITSLCATGSGDVPEGLVHVHDCLRVGVR